MRDANARHEEGHWQQNYRVTLVVEYLGWVDYDFGHSSVRPVLLGQVGLW